MKWFIWIAIFMAYLLSFIGIFLLLSNITKGIMVEMEVEREVYGEIVTRTQEVEFNDIPAVRWIFGMSGLFIAIGGSYLFANYLSKSWDIDFDKKMGKTERLIWISVFTVFFFAFSFIFRIHTIDDVFGYMGWLFMAVTCAGAYAVSTAICKLPAVATKISPVENEVMR